jgi:HPt (histidine-containing phosphotransfer) domain-containing protein
MSRCSDGIDPVNDLPNPVYKDNDTKHGISGTDQTVPDEKNRPVALVPEFLESLIPGYIENRRADIINIRQLVQNNEFEEAQRLAHSMKGSGGGYGFTKISELGASMEIAAGSLDGNGILSGIDELEKYLDTVRIEYVDDDD